MSPPDRAPTSNGVPKPPIAAQITEERVTLAVVNYLRGVVDIYHPDATPEARDELAHQLVTAAIAELRGE